MDRRVGLGVLASVIVVVIAVVAVTVSASARHIRTPAERALALWKDFPATVVPRPVVFLGSVNAPAAGFPTANAKEAYIVGRFILRAELPAAHHRSTRIACLPPPQPSAF
jgi:hypothetical protein